MSLWSLFPAIKTSEPQPKIRLCSWRQDSDYSCYWLTSCSQQIAVTNVNSLLSGPLDGAFLWCPYCRGEVKRVGHEPGC